MSNKTGFISDDEMQKLEQKQPAGFISDEDMKKLTPTFISDEEMQKMETTPVQDRGFFDKPLLGAEYTTPEEVVAIAKKYNVNEKELLDAAPFLGARMKDSSFFSPEELKRGLGGLSTTFGFGLPTKIYKKAQTPEMERAMDELQNLAQDRQSFLQLGTELAAPVGVGKKAGALGGAAVGAIQGYGMSDRESEGLSTALGAGIGGVLGDIGKRLAKEAAPAVEKETATAAKEAAEVVTDLTEKEQKLGELLQKELERKQKYTKEEFKQAGITSREYNQYKRELAAFLGPNNKVGGSSTNVKRIEDTYYQMTGKDRIKELSDFYLTLKKEGIKNPNVTRSPDWLEKAQDYLSASTPLAGKIAAEIGRPVDLHLGKLSKGLTKGKEAYDSFKPDILKLVDNLESNKVSPERFFELDYFMQGKDVTKMDELLAPLNATIQEKMALRRAHDLYWKAEQDITNRGSKLQTLRPENPTTKPENVYYSPRQMVEYPEMLAKSKQYLDEIQPSFNWKDTSLVARTFEDSPEKVSDLIKVMEITTGRDIVAINGSFRPEKYQEAVQLWGQGYRALANSRGGRLVSEAGNIKKRFDKVPTFLLEKDPIQKISRYLNNIYKHVETEPYLNKLMQDREWAKLKGNERAATAIDNIIKSALGSSEDALSGTLLSRKIATQAKLEELISGDNVNKARMSRIAKGLGATGDYLAGQMYKNLLASPKSALLNYMQTLSQTIPEIGYLNGPALWAKALYNLGKDLKTRGKVASKLAQWEDLPYNQDRYFESIIRNGLLTDGPFGRFLKRSPALLEKLTDLSMILWKQADIFNKYMVNSIGEEMAKSMIKSPDKYKFFLRTVTPGYRDAILAARSKNNESALSELLQTYLSTKTVFNYDRPSMSQFARDLGPMFGAFMRFPTETIGEILAIKARPDMAVRDKVLYSAQKLAAPVALGAIANSLLFGDPEGPGKKSEEDTKKDVVGRALLGQQGFVGPAMATSFLNVLDEGYTPSPLLQTPIDLVKTTLAAKDLMSDDDQKKENAKKKLSTATGNFLSTFGMGAGLLLLANDAMKIKEAVSKGELPEKGLGAQRALPKQAIDELFGVER
jgi:hypothetical protein